MHLDKETLLALRGEFTRLKNRVGITRPKYGICHAILQTGRLDLHDAAVDLWLALGYDDKYPVEVEGFSSNKEAYDLSFFKWEGAQGEARDKFLKHLISHIDNVLAGEVRDV